MGAAAAAAVALSACADPGSTEPRRAASEPVRLSLALQVSAAARALDVSVGYRSGSAGTTVLLLRQQIMIAGTREAPLAVGIAPCLADEQREGAGGAGAPACVLRISVALLGASSETLDESDLPAMTVRPGDVAQAQLAVGARMSFVQLALGTQHTCRTVTTSGGATTCWGANAAGQLGDGTTADRMAPTQIVAPSLDALDFMQIGAGQLHSCGLTRVGTAVCWGESTGQVSGGGGALATAAAPAPVNAPVPFTQLVVGSAFACGLGSDGLTYCWGNNAFAALGDGTLAARSNPAPIKGGHRFKRLVAGGNFACGLTDGPVYCWGSIDGRVPTPAIAAIGPVGLPGSDIVRIASLAPGFAHACGITTDGTAACIGRNSSGQLGDGTTTDRDVAPVFVGGGLHFTSLTAGGSFTCGIATDGFAYCWGANSFGQLGDGTTANRSVPTRVSGNIAFATIAAGSNHTCGATSSGKTYCWGQNSSGQLGDGTKGSRSQPTAVK